MASLICSAVVLEAEALMASTGPDGCCGPGVRGAWSEIARLHVEPLDDEQLLSKALERLHDDAEVEVRFARDARRTERATSKTVRREQRHEASRRRRLRDDARRAREWKRRSGRADAAQESTSGEAHGSLERDAAR